MRALLTFVWCGAIAVVTLAVAMAADASAPCRTAFVGPYAEQCEYNYKALKAGASRADLAQAFFACARSQEVDLPCVNSSDRQMHALALGVLYRSVTLQGNIALAARQFGDADALLHERLKIIDIVQREVRPGDDSPGKERTAAQRELAQAQAGECAQRAVASAPQQSALGKAHKYADLSVLLKKTYDDDTACARTVTAAAERAYVQYVGLVALEESGRAAQAAGQKDVADRTYQDCIDGAAQTARSASARVKGYLGTVAALCRSRKDGSYAVDRPQPLDARDVKAVAPPKP